MLQVLDHQEARVVVLFARGKMTPQCRMLRLLGVVGVEADSASPLLSRI